MLCQRSARRALWNYHIKLAACQPRPIVVRRARTQRTSRGMEITLDVTRSSRSLRRLVSERAPSFKKRQLSSFPIRFCSNGTRVAWSCAHHDGKMRFFEPAVGKCDFRSLTLSPLPADDVNFRSASEESRILSALHEGRCCEMQLVLNYD